MVFQTYQPTPPIQGSAATLLPLGIVNVTNAVALVSPPSTGTSGQSLTVNGTVLPSGTAVRVGFSSSSTVAPSSWLSAAVTGGNWTASYTPPSAGTLYIWAEQTGNTAIQAVSAALVISAPAGTVSISAPSTGTAGTALSITGSVTPTSDAVQIGISSSSTTSPGSWVSATNTSGAVTGSLTPASAGTWYAWIEDTVLSDTAVSSAITVAAAPEALTYSIVSGSGSGLAGGTFSTANTAVDWASSLVHGSTDVAPNLGVSGIATVASAKFWFDTNATNYTVPGSFSNSAGTGGGAVFFYAASTDLGQPTAAPPAPSAGTYYGKYALYNSSSALLGVVTTSAITVT